MIALLHRNLWRERMKHNKRKYNAKVVRKNKEGLNDNYKCI